MSLPFKASSLFSVVTRPIHGFFLWFGILVVLTTVLYPEYVHANGIHQNAVEVFNGKTSTYDVRVVTIPEIGITHFSIILKPIQIDHPLYPIEIYGTAESTVENSLPLESTGSLVDLESPYLYSIDFPIATSGTWTIKLVIQELNEKDFVEFQVAILEPVVVNWWVIILAILAIFAVIGIVSKKMSPTNNRC